MVTYSVRTLKVVHIKTNKWNTLKNGLLKVINELLFSAGVCYRCFNTEISENLNLVNADHSLHSFAFWSERKDFLLCKEGEKEWIF